MFYIKTPAAPTQKTLKGIAALKIGVLTRVWKKLLISLLSTVLVKPFKYQTEEKAFDI